MKKGTLGITLITGILSLAAAGGALAQQTADSPTVLKPAASAQGDGSSPSSDHAANDQGSMGMGMDDGGNDHGGMGMSGGSGDHGGMSDGGHDSGGGHNGGSDGDGGG